jgi:hypothetical protein
MKLVLALLALSAVCAAQRQPVVLTLDAVRSEGDPLRRFERALQFADARLNTAWKLVREGGSRTELESAISDLVAASELSLESLRSTGRRPGKLSRQYKRGELRLRSFEKALKELSLAVGFDEREQIEQARQRVAEIHEKFLLAVMTGK